MKAAERPLVLINSGAYTGKELSAEFGLLPPAFLPVGLGRLYELQVRMLGSLNGELCLTLPESFDLQRWDADRLEALGCTVIRTPDALSLGAALLYALGHLGFSDRPLRVLHGDTLVSGMDLELDDVLAVAKGGDGYRWGQARLDAEGMVEAVSAPGQFGEVTDSPRICGYFAFGSAARFAEKLAVASGDFYAALERQAAAGAGLRGVQPERWLDFGHVQTFFRSRRIVTTERAFNSLQIGETYVRKRSSNDSRKLRAEYKWLREAPPAVMPFCARVLEEGEDEKGYFYDSQYEYMPTLSELYVFGKLAVPAWAGILGSCANFIDATVQASTSSTDPTILRRLVVDKTGDRLETYARKARLDLDAPLKLNGRATPSLRRCLEEIAATLASCGHAPSVMHGDFCFSNILYSFRTGRVRVIDPRGLTETGEFSQEGDRRYDLAKLMHSVCGRYDLILAGHYEAKRTAADEFELAFPVEPWRQELETIARQWTMGGYRLGGRVVWAAMTSLFLSMPPLHADRPDRQEAFVANALRLFFELDNIA